MQLSNGRLLLLPPLPPPPPGLRLRGDLVYHLEGNAVAFRGFKCFFEPCPIVQRCRRRSAARARARSAESFGYGLAGEMVIFAGGTASRDVVKARSRVVLAGPPASPPETTSVFCDRVSLRWGAPISSGGFAIRGYRVQAQAGGHGDFKDVITDTQDGNTDCVVTRLTCTTWYEFRVAALNVHGTGAWSEASEPVLTPAADSNASGKPGQRRQRRSRQTGGPKAAAARAQVEEARMQLMAYAEQLALSERTVQQWEDDWRVQPHAEGVVFVSATAHRPGL